MTASANSSSLVESFTQQALSDSYIRLSYSALETLNSCERKFQLERLLEGNDTKETSEHLSFGQAFGAGVQSYLQHQDADAALYAAWLAYWPLEESDSKDQARCFIALMAAFPKLDTLLLDYELAFTASGQPCVELSFRLNIDAVYYFVGYIDAVLRSRFTGRYVVLEIKTTGVGLLDLSPMYQHSGQALGYSIVLDQVAGMDQSSYDVIYFVAQLQRSYNEVRVHVLTFPKTLLDRLQWFVTLSMDVKRLHDMSELGIYPKRGAQCLRFNKPCRFFGTCQLHSLDSPKVLEEDTVDYQFVYLLDDLVRDHLQRVASGEGVEDTQAVGMYD